MKYRVFFNLVIYSGFRRSELLGLEWKDIDFDEGLVHIRRISNYVAGKGMYTDTTKTKKSQRVLLILIKKSPRTETTHNGQIMDKTIFG